MADTRVIIIDDLEDIHHNIRSIFQSRKNEVLENLNQELFGSVAPDVELKRTLQQLHFDSAFQGQEGFEMIKKAYMQGRPYALAIVDMRMPPGWDGLETIRTIRSIDQNIEIIICSAYSDYSWHDIALELGVSDKYLFLSKPFEITEMKQMVINLTEKWWLNMRNKAMLEELAKARETSEASNLAKREFLGIIGHELRTPLNVILMTIEDMLDSQADVESLKIIKNSHQSTLRLAQMVEDIITYTELDRTDFLFKTESFRLSELLNTCSRQAQESCQEKGLSFSLKKQPDLPEEFQGDFKRITSILLQLLKNAARFTDQGGIEIDIHVNEGFARQNALGVVALCFEIRDSGRGMDAEQLAQCFNLFYTGESPREHGRTGAGLGLSLCLKLAQAMGGELSMSSELGKGSISRVTLPLRLAKKL